MSAVAVQTALRNIAVVAHVDHGKTTMIDALLRQTGAFHAREAVQERVMDSYELERERGITILAKNASLYWKDVKVNIVDTPGHADFGGEVERALHMADGVLLLVDAFEGPMPQTRFVLRKALERGLRAVVALNKADRPGCDPDRAHNQVFDLFAELGANDEQLDFPVVYTSGVQGWARTELDGREEDMQALLDLLVDFLPAPRVATDAPLRMLVSNIDYNEFLGRIAIGRVDAGCIRQGQSAYVLGADGAASGTVERLHGFRFLSRVEIDSAEAGDVVAICGLSDVTVGDTIAETPEVEAFERPEIDPPTLSMEFGVNTSPFAGRDGRYVTSRHLKHRLDRELHANVALKVEPTDSADVMRVSGRGLLHLSILIEQMRREGYEVEISRPQVILREIDGVRCEPVEGVLVEVPSEYVGNVVEILGSRGAAMTDMEETGRMTRLAFSAPSRGLIGVRSRLMSATKGEAIFYHAVSGYEPVKPQDMRLRIGGALVSATTGSVTGYALLNLQDRGRFFVRPGDEVYEGQVIGETQRPEEIAVNVTRAKHLTNIRSATKEMSEKLNAPREMGLEDGLEFIAEDELVEVTPGAIRMRKRVLEEKARLREQRQTRKMARG